ncbi:MAG TPA: hypothetical protein VJY41_03855, partial [Prolixibacteraceae bacterium]|nr:hypothetical protein [Prolixibacteraceae bacterium]
MKITKRVLSDDEFLELKSKMGAYEEGVNYNVKINGFGTGLIPPKPEQLARMKTEAIMVDNMLFDSEDIPISHDNSATKWFPPIGHQGSEGSCVAWAAGYYNKTFQEAMEHDWDLSACAWENGWTGYPSAAYQDKIFSPDFIYHQINDGVDGGAYYSDAMDLLYGVGCCTWNKMPYSMSDHTSWPSETAWRQAPLYRSGTSHNYVNVTNDTNIGNLKQFLANYNNAIIAIDANYYPSLTSNDLWTSD